MTISTIKNWIADYQRMGWNSLVWDLILILAMSLIIGMIGINGNGNGNDTEIDGTKNYTSTEDTKAEERINYVLKATLGVLLNTETETKDRIDYILNATLSVLLSFLVARELIQLVMSP